MILGLTGGSGTGKSSACEFFAKKGFVIIDMDKLSRKVCRKGERCLKEIIEYFGRDIIDDEGELIRKKLGDIVFADGEKLEVLNRITHKYILKETTAIIKENRDKDIVLDAAVLFESGAHTLCTDTLCILADEKVRLSRIMKRDSLSEESAKNRIESQPDDKFYIARCDVALYNNGTAEELYAKLGGIYGK